jgi:hypothetical protein
LNIEHVLQFGVQHFAHIYFMSYIAVVYPWSELNIITQYLNFTLGILTIPMMHNHMYFIEQTLL